MSREVILRQQRNDLLNLVAQLMDQIVELSDPSPQKEAQGINDGNTDSSVPLGTGNDDTDS
jgi:hypothetical protein